MGVGPPPHTGTTTAVAPPAGAAPDRPRLRWVLVLGLAATHLITWPLWQAREAPPNLPAVPLPSVDLGWALLAALVLALARPRWGVPVYTVLLALAMVADQLRIQPEFVCMTILLWATLPVAGLVLAGRAQLAALYFYAGLHKALGEQYVTKTGATFWQSIVPWLEDEWATVVAIAVAILELSLGVMILVRPARRIAAWVVCGTHLLIVGAIASGGTTRNLAIWPWNVALAVVAPALIASWRTPLGAVLRTSRRWALVLAATLLLSPLLYRVCLLDAYLSWSLYADTPAAVLLRADTIRNLEESGKARFRMPNLSTHLKELSVPFPPAHRLFEAYYRAVKEPGDVLWIHDPRPWARRLGIEERVLTTDGDLGHLTAQGDWLDHHPDGGGLASRGRAERGVKVGLWTYWDAKGRLQARGAYREGRRRGPWTLWNREGVTRQVAYPGEPPEPGPAGR